MTRMRKNDVKLEEIKGFWMIKPYLLNNIKDKNFEGRRLYKESESIFSDLRNKVYAVCNKGHNIIGFIWCYIDLLTNTLLVKQFYVDDNYKESFLKVFKKEIYLACNTLKLKHVGWITSDHDAAKECGFEESEVKIFELKPDKGE